LCLSFLILWEWFEKDPIVDVRVLGHFNFATANIMMFMAGAVAFGNDRVDAAVFAEFDGIHSGKGRDGAVGRGDHLTDRTSVCGFAFFQDFREIPAEGAVSPRTDGIFRVVGGHQFQHHF
jgi:hypothetical protein